MNCRVSEGLGGQWPCQLLLVLKSGLLFGLIGPPLGLFVNLLIHEAPNVIKSGDVLPALFYGLVEVLVGLVLGGRFLFFIGALPAFFAGLLYGVALLVANQTGAPSLRFRLIVGLLVGGVATASLSLLWPKLLELVITGAIAGAIIAACMRTLSVR